MFGFVKQHAHSEECTAKETTEFLFWEQDHLMFISNKLSFTFASSCALLGIDTLGKAYMAPITSLHLIPSIELNVSATSLALSLNDWSTAFFS